MKKILSAVLAMGISLSLAACGESMERPTEPTQPTPVWAQAPAETTAPLLTTAPTEESTVPTETEVTTEPTEEALSETETQETEEATTPEEPAAKTYPMEEKFEPASGTLYAKKRVNIRDQANTDSLVLTKLKQGEQVQVVGTSPDGWTAIYREDRVCYVSSEYLVEEQVEAPTESSQAQEQKMDDQVYTNHGVNMRESGDYNAPILVKIPEYTELHRIGTTNTGWFKVEYKDMVGYVNEAYIVPKYVDSEEHPTETVVEEQVHTTREVNLRKGPGTDKEILGRIPEGTEITRIATTSTDWSKVIYKDQEGYVSSKYLEKGSNPEIAG